MKLQKAIEILELNLKAAGNKMPPDVKDALLLHIEAAKVFQHGRRIGHRINLALLPGETEQ